MVRVEGDADAADVCGPPPRTAFEAPRQGPAAGPHACPSESSVRVRPSRLPQVRPSRLPVYVRVVRPRSVRVVSPCPSESSVPVRPSRLPGVRRGGGARRAASPARRSPPPRAWLARPTRTGPVRVGECRRGRAPPPHARLGQTTRTDAVGPASRCARAHRSPWGRTESGCSGVAGECAVGFYRRSNGGLWERGGGGSRRGAAGGGLRWGPGG